MQQSRRSSTISKKTNDVFNSLSIHSLRRWTGRRTKTSEETVDSGSGQQSIYKNREAIINTIEEQSFSLEGETSERRRRSRKESRSSTPMPVPVPMPSEVHVVRQSVQSDVRDVLDLELTCHKAMFGEVDIEDCIDKRICRSMFNVDTELIAFIVLQCHPNVPSLSYCGSWINWARRYYRLDDLTPENTCFISYLVWDPRYRDFFDPLMKSLYKNNVRLEQAILIVPPGIQMFKELSDYFTCVYPLTVEEGGQSVYLNLRLRLIKKLVVRKAAEEDNIDIQPLVACQHDILKRIFGDFKLGDVIDLSDHSRTEIVAEYKAVTVGVLSASVAVDYQQVTDYFFVPLHDFYSRPGDLTRCDTNRKEESVFGPTPNQEEDLTSLSPETFLDDVESLVDSDVISYYYADDLDQDILLDDNDSEFHIVDPAIEYLMSKKKTFGRTDSVDLSVDSTTNLSGDLTTHFGPICSPARKPSYPEVMTRPLTRNCLGQYVQSPPYAGPDKGFKISLFALHPDLDHRYAHDLLEAAFSCYPERNYCLMALPTDYQGSPITKYFVRLTPRHNRDYPHDLYIVHRNSIFSEFRVRAACRADCDAVGELVETMFLGRSILKDVTAVLTEESCGGLVFVLECEHCIVGVALLTTDFALQQLRPHYSLEGLLEPPHYDWSSHGLLRHCVLSPLFLRRGPYFLTQIMHLAGLDTLSFCLMPTDQLTKVGMSHVKVLGDLHPVQPLHPITYYPESLVVSPPEFVLGLDNQFALFVTTERLLSITKLELGYRIIVVGGSETALSFLENLIFESAKKYIRYSNLTLVSLHGLPLQAREHRAGDSMLASSGHYTRTHLTRLSLQSHVNILFGVVTSINRSAKMICLNDDFWMRYDYMFLFTGTQYCKPVPGSITGQGVNSEACQRHQTIRELYSQISCQQGDNLFLINTPMDTVIALTSLKRIVQTKKIGKLVVYGSGINTYTCVGALLTFGVPGSRIVVVHSSEPCGHHAMDLNREIEKTVETSMKRLGVSLVHGHRLYGWTIRRRVIHKVEFRTESKTPLSIECLAMFCFGRKVTSAKTYRAITESGLVFNNGIIIDHQFRTNDQFIYAAGPGTRYSGRVGDQQQADHALLSSVDVGRQASVMFRRLVEPRPADGDHEDQDGDPSVPGLRAPVTVVASLPGGWHYLRVSAPGPPLPLECQLQGQGDSGAVLITGEPIDPDGPGYFQLSLTVHGTVREISCLSMTEIPVHNLQKLYGKHERLLNNLYDKYHLGLVPDLYGYFSQPWACALYTTGFDQLIMECADIFQADEEAGMKVLREVITSNLDKDTSKQRVSLESLDQVSQMYRASSLPHYVQYLTLRYVTDHSLQLPMYLTDEVLAEVMRAYAASPMHRDPSRGFKHSNRSY